METIAWNNLTLNLSEEGDYYTVTGCAEGATEIEIPALVEGLPVCGIEANAFEGCSALTRVTLPSEVGEDVYFTVGDGAFACCDALTEITLPPFVGEVGWGAFRSCRRLARVRYDGRVYLAPYAFTECRALAEIPPVGCASEGVLSYTAIEELTLEGELEYIGENAFEGCERLREVVIPRAVRQIDALAFRGCRALERVVFEDPEGWWECNSYREADVPLSLSDPERNAAWLSEMDFDDGTLYWYRKPSHKTEQE